MLTFSSQDTVHRRALLRSKQGRYDGSPTTLIAWALPLLLLVCAQHQAFGKDVCEPEAKVDQAITVSSDGASLYVLIRGKTSNAPLLLWLHGGPGGAETPLFRLY